MNTIFSTYDAKARFSEVLRMVRDGNTITVSYRGEPVAEIRPIVPQEGIGARFAQLEKRGVLRRPLAGRGEPGHSAHRPGGLRRFLESRDS